MAIDWNNVSPGSLPTGNPTGALQQASGAFDSLARQGFAARELNNVDRARQDAEDARLRVIADKQKLIDRDNEVSGLGKAVAGDIGARFKTPEMLAAVKSNPALANLNDAQLADYQSKFATANPDLMARNRSNAISDFSNQLDLRNDMTLADKDAAKARFTANYFPGASAEQIEAMKDIRDTKSGFGVNGSGSKSSGSKGSNSLGDSGSIVENVTNVKDVSDGIVNNLWYLASEVVDKSDLADGSSYLLGMGINPADVETTLTQVLKDGGAIKENYDWVNSQTGKDNLLSLAQTISANNKNNGTSNGEYYLPADQRFQQSGELLKSLTPQGMESSALVDMFSKFASDQLKQENSVGPQIPRGMEGVLGALNGAPSQLIPTTSTVPLPTPVQAKELDIALKNNTANSSYAAAGGKDPNFAQGNVGNTNKAPSIPEIFKGLSEMVGGREGVNNFLNTPLIGDQSIIEGNGNLKNLADALKTAETGGESNSNIRTKISDAPGGSTAYGSHQLTATLAKDMVTRHGRLFSPKEKSYVDKFLAQGKKFAMYGNSPDKEGYDKRYDYGGEGDLTSKEDKAMYDKVIPKILQGLSMDLKRKLGREPNQQEIAEAWRGVSADQDPVYFNKLSESLAG